MIYTRYDDLTIEEIVRLFQNYGDMVLLHNGHVVGFTRES